MTVVFNETILPRLPSLEHNSPSLIDPSNAASETDKRGKQMSLDEAHKFYAGRRAEGPTFPCCSCRRTWFKRGVRQLTTVFEENLPLALSECLTNLPGPQGMRYLCETCYDGLKSRKKPKLCRSNMPDFPPIPAELRDMTDMENHLVAPRIPFMKVYALPRGGQRGVHGGVVNVPTNLSKVQQQLPRHLQSRETITINLNRRVCFKGAYKSSGVRPTKVVDQLRYLVAKPLYKDPGVSLDKSWLPEASRLIDLETSVASNASEEAEFELDRLASGPQGVVGMDANPSGSDVDPTKIDLTKRLTLDEEDALRRN